MKLEVGMYVRTDDGEIGKITHIETETFSEPAYTLDIFTQGTYKGCKWFEGKASHNIIDLIEPLDLMYIDICPDDCGGIVVPRIAETLRELNDFKERFASGNCILKGVVTKEQIKAKTYWVGE